MHEEGTTPNWVARDVSRFARGPFWRSATFALLVVMLGLVVLTGTTLIYLHWDRIPRQWRFEAVFIVATSFLPLWGVLRQRKLLEGCGLDEATERRVSALTLMVLAWSYGLLATALGLALALLRRGY